MAKVHVVKNINQTGQSICVVCQENVHEFLGVVLEDRQFSCHGYVIF